MAKYKCTADGCNENSMSRGLCARHYGQQYRDGTLVITPNPDHHRLRDVDVVAKAGVCSICGPVGVRIRESGRSPECMTQARKRRGKSTRTDTTAKSRLRKYRITSDQLAAMLDRQAGKCPICEIVLDKYHVDHNHLCCPGKASCGKCVRGLLCYRCNFALGWFNDSVQSLNSAIRYLTRHDGN